MSWWLMLNKPLFNSKKTALAEWRETDHCVIKNGCMDSLSEALMDVAVAFSQNDFDDIPLPPILW